MKASISYDEG